MSGKFTRHTGTALFMLFSVLLFCISVLIFSADAAAEEISAVEVSAVETPAGEGTAGEGTAGEGTVNEAPDIWKISTVEEFFNFVSLCQDNSWSVGRTVELTADLDFSGQSMTPVPFFSGTFHGGQHTLSGISISSSDSRVGLFAVLTGDAYVSELRITGTVISEGEGIAGGLAGENCGTVSNCIFQGTVTAAYSAGGIAGINFGSGLIADSKVSGTVTGKLCAGGITGDNIGTVRSCENYANVSNGVNALTALLNRSLLKGGICGTSTGSVENSTDHTSQSGRDTLSDTSSPDVAHSTDSAAQNSGHFQIRVSRGILLLALCILLALHFISAMITLIACSGKERMY